MAAAAMQEMTDEQLAHEVLQNERDLVSLQFQHSMSALENTARISQVRKAIARLKTEARRREIEQGLAKDSLIPTHSKTFAKTEGAATPTDEEEGGFLSGIVDKLTGKE